MSRTEADISINGLSCRYPKSEALYEVSLRVPTGSVFGLVGLNGAGKTTLIRHVMGSLRPQHGTVRVLGEDPTQSPENYCSESVTWPRKMRSRAG